MSENNTPAPPLSIVSSFSGSTYPYPLHKPFADPQDAAERIDVMRQLRQALALARIADYKLLERPYGVDLHLKTVADVEGFAIACLPEMPIEQVYATFEKDYDFRKLKRQCTKLQARTDRAGFHDTLVFDLDRRERQVIVLASSKKAYFDFLALDREDNLRKNFLPDRKIPAATETAKPETTADIVKRITMYTVPDEDAMDVEDHIESYPEDYIPAEPSKPYIEGGWNDRMHGPRRQGTLSIAASYRENVHNFKLDMSIGYNPQLNATDRLFQYDPTYPEFKLERAIPKRMDEIRRAMSLAGVEDYFLWEKHGRIKGYFSKPQDLAVAVAAVSPDSAYRADFIHCSQNASAMKLKTRAKRLQAIFAENAGDLNVRFVADLQRHVIAACTDNRDDFIRLQGVARKLEKSNPPFQRLVGLN